MPVRKVIARAGRKRIARAGPVEREIEIERAAPGRVAHA
jgi:hypothetical protein